MAMEDILLLALIDMVAMPGHTWKPPDYGPEIYEVASDTIVRPSSQAIQQNLRARRNYILHGQSYWNPTGPEISRKLRGRKSETSDTDETAHTASKRNELDDLRTTYALPTLLTNVALGYYKSNCNDSVNVASGISISGLTKITTEGRQASLYATEHSTTFKVSLLLPLKVKTCVGEIPYERKAAISVKLQFTPVPVFTLDDFRLLHAKDVVAKTKVDSDSIFRNAEKIFKEFMKSIKQKCEDKFDEYMLIESVKDKIKAMLKIISTIIQKYDGFSVEENIPSGPGTC